MTVHMDMIARRFRSPLLGTALVLLSLSALAVPLHKLTTRGAPVARHAALEKQPAGESIRAVLRVRVLDPLFDWEIRTAQGEVLHRAASIEPGEIEEDVEVFFENDSIDLLINARTNDKETAVFVTLLPDGHEAHTAYAIGSGTIRETLHFHWQHPHP